MRRACLLAAGLLVAIPVTGQESEYFEPPAPRAKFTFRWEALFRYDSIYHLRVRPDIERGRFEVRPEVAYEPSDRFKLGVRAVGNAGTDDNPDHARNFDNYRLRLLLHCGVDWNTIRATPIRGRSPRSAA